MNSQEIVDSFFLFHVGGNDIKSHEVENCVTKVEKLLKSTRNKFKHSKISVSLDLARNDSQDLNRKIELFNVNIKQVISQVENCVWCDNSNLAYRGRPNTNCFDRDGVHLNRKGVQILKALGVNVFESHQSYFWY